jgi:hypothetical protein
LRFIICARSSSRPAERGLAVGAAPIVDAGGAETELRGADRGDVAARPAADHHDIEGFHPWTLSIFPG